MPFRNLLFPLTVTVLLHAQGWTQLTPAGTPPGPQDPAAVFDPATRQMVVYGLPDFWTLNVAGAGQWTQHSPSGTPPQPRTGTSAVSDGIGSMILFGGVQATTCL